MDPYVYPNSTVLINKLHIVDAQKLIDIEAQLFIAGVIDIHTIFDDLDFSNYKCLQLIHRFLFENIYNWAGDFRKINIFKNETVLGGLSVLYSEADQIIRELTNIFNWSTKIQWSHENQELPLQFAKLMTDIWRVHPYREGNTRTVSVFMRLFAEKHNLSFNAELLSQNAGYLRQALVLAAVNEAPEPEYLLRIITDALKFDTSHISNVTTKNSGTYQKIKHYDVTKYKEKSFYTKSDEHQ